MMKKAKKNRPNILVILIAILSVLLIALLGMILWLEFGGALAPHGTEPQQTTASVSEPTETGETTRPTEPAITVPTQPSEVFRPQDLVTGTAVIETPYLTLNYPEAFEDILAVVHTTGNPYTLEFYTVLEGRSSQRLFDISFEKGVEGNLGILDTPAGKVGASMKIYAFQPDSSWTDGEINTVLAMQDASNDLIEQLTALLAEEKEVEGPVISTEAPNPGLADFVSITTPYCPLYYPLSKQPYLQTEHTEKNGIYYVAFYAKLDSHDPVLLFTILFGGDDGDQLGAILDENGQFVTVVNVMLAELNMEGFTDSEMTIVYEMQEAVNDTLFRIPIAP